MCMTYCFYLYNLIRVKIRNVIIFIVFNNIIRALTWYLNNFYHKEIHSIRYVESKVVL